jgi:hypothetical protein
LYEVHVEYCAAVDIARDVGVADFRSADVTLSLNCEVDALGRTVQCRQYGDFDVACRAALDTARRVRIDDFHGAGVALCLGGDVDVACCRSLSAAE